MKISMIPFGLLSGFMDSKEIRLTELEEEGFRFRLAEECPEPECFLICFYDMKKAGYRKVEIRKFEMNVVMLAAEERRLQENSDIFFREYSVKVEQKDYVQEVQRLAGEYSRYIRLKLNGDDGELAEALTGYPAELDEVHCGSVEKLLEKVDNWCCFHGVNVEIVVNDWAMVEILRGKTSHLSPVFGTLINKRKKDPRMKYKSGDTALFQHNSLNAEFYRDFLAKEFHIHRYEWESCGYPQEFPPGKNSIHLPFYQTNTSQYCPLYALCTTGDRGMQQLAEHCPKFCEKYSLLYPEHLHMIGRYNSLFGVDKTLLESPEMWKKIKGIKPDRIVVNL